MDTNNDKRRYLKDVDIFDIYGLTLTSLRAYRRLGKGPPYVKIDDSKQGKVLYPVKLLEEWLESKLINHNKEEIK